EFQRLRLQYTYIDQPGNPQQPAHENQLFLQWTAILGSHVHGFRSLRSQPMQRLVLVALSIMLMLLASFTGAEAKIRVVATIPDLADMVRNIGGDLLEIKSLATGVEDIHAVPMKPSFASLLNRADIVLLVGLEVEHAFLPGLLEAARNPKILPATPGY